MEVKYREYNPDQMYFTIIDPEDIKRMDVYTQYCRYTTELEG